MPETAWDNRIVEYDPAVPLDQLLAHPRNPKIHPRPQTDALKGILGEVGWLTGLIVNTTTGHVLDGHDRIKAAMEAGQQTAPVFYVAVPEAQEPYILATFDPVGTLAATDSAVLTDLLREVSSEDAAVQALLASLVTEPLDVPTPGAGGDEFDATPQAGATRVQPGDLWAIGPHRLLCGDSTDPAAVARLMDGQRAAICFTSPPYNAGDSERLSGNTHTTDTKYVLGGADDLSDSGYQTLLAEFTALALAHCNYVFVNVQPLAGNKRALLDYWHAYRDQFADVAIWDKGHGAPAMALRVMNSQFELILVFAQQPAPSRAIGTREFRGTVPNVYQGPPQRNNEFAEVHAATFPLHLPTWVIETFTNPHDCVYEPFSGTGTTLIAAHRTGRVAYGLEIEPRYCDVILRRAEAEGIGPIARVTP